MKVKINDKYMLSSMDDKNLELHEYREVKPRNKDKENETRWVGTGHYFQSIQSALVWLLDHMMITEKQEFQSIKAAINHMEKITTELENFKVEQ